jgi:hypothetical protein
MRVKEYIWGGISIYYMSNQVLTLRASHPKQRARLGIPLKCIGLFMYVIGVVLFITLDLRTILPGVVSLYLGRIIYKKGRRYRSILEEYEAIEAIENDPTRVVLYLRSFNDDDATETMWEKPSTITLPFIGWLPSGITLYTEEEYLEETLREIGLPVTIGIPGEEIPRTGIPRLYATDDGWEQAVGFLMERAQLVIIRAGFTEGVAYELNMVFSKVKPHRLLILVPACDSNSEIKVLEMINKALPQKKIGKYTPWEKPSSSIAGLVYFSPNWKPFFVRFETQGGFRQKIIHDEIIKAIRDARRMSSEYL